MQHAAVRILNRHRAMAISTVRPDGWPQTTIVGYVNQGFDIFFLIFRSGQKFANIQHDDRIAVAVGAEPTELRNLQAVYAGGHAQEVTDPAEREEVWRLLMERSSNLAGFKMPEAQGAAFMKFSISAKASVTRNSSRSMSPAPSLKVGLTMTVGLCRLLDGLKSEERFPGRNHA
jgi:nitroimidazol reductase NimA-like FMN-containing flavoprotein (pyridoxamine 5'-phosphate oxidase superfamily)